MNPAPEADDVRALREIVADLARLPDANRHLAGLMSGLALRYDLGDQDPFVGTRMIDLSLRTADGPTTVSELLTNGRGLLLEVHGPGGAAGADRDHPPTAAAMSCAPAGARSTTSRPRSSTRRSAQTYPPARALVRPDGYVCWASDDPAASPEPALRRWFGVPVRPGA